MAKTPKPPNPYQQASAQQQAELAASMGSSIINNPNIYSPYGSQTYDVAGYETIYDAQGKPMQVPRYNMRQTLSPEQQQLLGLNNQMQMNLGQTGVEQSAKLRGLLGTNVDAKGLQGWAGGTTEPTDRAAIENAMMKLYKGQADPKNRAEQNQLALRGMGPGSQGYGSITKRQGDEFTDASLKAYLGSGAESREASGFLNNLRQAQLQERLALRNQPINEITALLGASGVTTPQFQPFSAQGIGAAPIGSYIGQNYANQAQAAAQQNAGLFGLGGAALGGIGSAGGFGNFFKGFL